MAFFFHITSKHKFTFQCRISRRIIFWQGGSHGTEEPTLSKCVLSICVVLLLQFGHVHTDCIFDRPIAGVHRRDFGWNVQQILDRTDIVKYQLLTELSGRIRLSVIIAL